MLKLTVIVPIYNVAEYLDQCLESIARQVYPEIEIILVDDGSNDGSTSICDKIASCDKRFIAIHKRNGGLSSARNIGLLLSDSEYITFVDSDDYLIGQPYKYLMEIAESINADVIGMNYSSEIISINNYNKPPSITTKFQRRDLIKHLFIQDISESVWNKIFKRELFNDVLFDEGILNEDFLWFMNVLIRRNINFVMTDYMGYFYRHREGSTTKVFGHNMIDAIHNALYAKENNPFIELNDLANNYLLKKILFYLVNMPSSYIKNNNIEYLEVLEILLSNSGKINNCDLSIRDKIVLRSFLRKPFFTKYLIDSYFKLRKCIS